MKKRTVKMIFFGLAKSGKSTILQMIVGQKITKEMDFHATIDYERLKLLVNDEIEVTIFDCGGVTAFLNRFTGALAEFLFSGLTTFVFVVDSIEIHISSLSLAKYYLDLSLNKIEQYSPQAHIFLFQHKADLIPQKLHKEVYQTVKKYLLKGISRDIHYYETTIYQNRINDVMRAVFETTIGAPLTSYSRIMPEKPKLLEGRSSAGEVLVNKSVVIIARLIELKKKPIFIPPEFIENLMLEDPEKRWAIMIPEPWSGLHGSDIVIRTIPTKSPRVLKVQIKYDLEQSTWGVRLRGAVEVFSKYKIKTLYGVGMCEESHANCPVGFIRYIDSYDLPVSADQLRVELLTMPIITDVEIINVKTIDLLTSEPVVFPSEFLDKAFLAKKEEDEDAYDFAVMIFRPSYNRIQIIPTKSLNVVKITIEFDDGNFHWQWEEMHSYFKTNNIRYLYNIARKITQNSCTCYHLCTCEGSIIREYYLDLSDLTLSQEQLKEELAEIQGLIKVDITSIV